MCFTDEDCPGNHSQFIRNADELAAAAIAVLMPLKHLLHTITADNGKEFATHKKIAKGLDIDCYFACPYHSWERGNNENQHGYVEDLHDGVQGGTPPCQSRA